MKPSSNRRASERIKVREGSYAYLASGLRKVGEILDISPEGIAFKYMLDSTCLTMPEGPARLEIFNRNTGLRLKGLSFTPASDVPLEGLGFLQGTFMRRLGGRFDGITPAQRTLVGNFIQKVAITPST